MNAHFSLMNVVILAMITHIVVLLFFYLRRLFIDNIRGLILYQWINTMSPERLPVFMGFLRQYRS